MVDQGDDWGKYLDAALFSTNTSVQSTTKVTPFRMMFGREPRFPLEAEKACELANEEDMLKILQTTDAESVMESIIKKQKALFMEVDERIQQAQKKQKEQYKKRKGIVDYDFKIGDEVLRRNMLQKTRKGNQGQDRWLGPFTIVELTTTSCLLRNKQGKVLKMRINLSQLKPYLQSETDSLQHDQDLPSNQVSLTSDNPSSFGTGSNHASPFSVSKPPASPGDDHTFPSSMSQATSSTGAETEHHTLTCDNHTSPSKSCQAPSLAFDYHTSLSSDSHALPSPNDSDTHPSSEREPNSLTADDFTTPFSDTQAPSSTGDNGGYLSSKSKPLTLTADNHTSPSSKNQLPSSTSHYGTPSSESKPPSSTVDNHTSPSKMSCTHSSAAGEHHTSPFLKSQALPSAEDSRCECRTRCATRRCPCKLHKRSCGPYCHPGRKCANVKKANDRIEKHHIDLTTTDDASSSSSTDVWIKVGQTQLTVFDKEVVGSGEWLSDKHIHAAQQLLKQQNPCVGGLQDPMLQNTHTFEVQEGEFVQILNLGRSHWITVSTIGCRPGQVKVYDSLHMNLTSSVKKTLAELLQAKSKKITIEYMDTQIQKGSCDCGLFAIATATALCHAQNPVHFEYTQGSMRNHLLRSFEVQALHPFPGKMIKKCKESLRRDNIQVYCKCRLPEDGRQMIECTGCKLWFHVDCVRCHKKALQKGVPWYCETCV